MTRPDTPTPGQLAYEAYWRTFVPQLGPTYMHPWADVHPQNQAAWEAAAQAVLEAHASLCPICGAELERCNARLDASAPPGT